MIDNISINSLRYFVKVAETRNITAAAAELFLTQPTLSRKVAKLEEDVGKKLLIRNTKGIELTQDGIAFYEQSKRIIAALSDIKKYRKHRTVHDRLAKTWVSEAYAWVYD